MHQPVHKNQIRNTKFLCSNFFFWCYKRKKKEETVWPLPFWNCNNNKNQKKFVICYLVFSHWLMQWNKPWGLGVLVTMPSSFLSTNSPSVKLISLRIDSSGFDDAGKDKIIDLKSISLYICKWVLTINCRQKKSIYLCTCLHTIYINFRKLLSIQINPTDLLQGQ